MAMTLFIGTPLFILIMYLSGEWRHLLALTGRSILLLSAAGIVHFVLGTQLFYGAIHALGANKAVSITRTNILFSVLFGVVLLREDVTVLLISGALLIMAGATLVSLGKEGGSHRFPVRGVVFALGAALSMAASATLIRPAMQEFPHIFAATFVSFIASFVTMAVFVAFNRNYRTQMIEQAHKTIFLLLGVTASMLVGHLLRFAALNYSPVSVVQPLQGTIAVFVLLLSWLINRRIDVFGWRVLVAIALVAAGAFLVSL